MIFAETFFIRDKVAPNAPVFALAALESKRRIEVSSDSNITELILNHYSTLEGGICSIWGAVKFYNYYHNDKCDVYSVEGKYLKTIEEAYPSNGASIILS